MAISAETSPFASFFASRYNRHNVRFPENPSILDGQGRVSQITTYFVAIAFAISDKHVAIPAIPQERHGPAVGGRDHSSRRAGR
jgi:hypothetical protein